MKTVLLSLFICFSLWNLPAQTWKTLIPDSTFEDFYTENVKEIFQLSDGNILVIGQGEFDISQSKLDLSGNIISQDTIYTWSVFVNPQNLNDSAIDSNDDVFHCGTEFCCGPVWNSFLTYVCKIDSDGNLIWRHDVTGTANSRRTFKRVIPTNDGGAWAMGDFDGKIMLYQLDSLGNLTIEKHYWETDIRYELMETTQFDDNYLLLSRKENIGMADSAVFFLVNPLGDLIWRKSVRTGDMGFFRVPERMRLDADKNIWLFDELSDIPWVGKLNSDGEILFGKKINEIKMSLLAPHYGNPIFTPDGGVILNAREKYPDCFTSFGIIFKLDSDGNLVWKKDFEFARNVRDLVRIDENKIIACGKPKYGEPNGILVWDMDNEGNVLVNNSEIFPTNIQLVKTYPNPLTDNFFIEFELRKNSTIHLSIFNPRGQIISQIFKKENFQKGKHTVRMNAQNWQNGIYWLILQTEKETVGRKLIKEK